MTTIRFVLSLFVLLQLLPASAGVMPAADVPLPLLNGNFEAGFNPVTVVGVAGMVGNHWTPFVITGTLAFQAGQVEPPLNRWQVLAADTGAYVAGIAQTVTGDLLPQDSLRATARVYPPASVDGITGTIGLDPLGGSDPTAPSVVWSSAGSAGAWATLTVTATAAATQTTVFVKVEQAAVGPHGLVFVDDVTLERTGRTLRTFLPWVTTPLGDPTWQYQATGIIIGATACTSTGLQGRVVAAGGAPQAGVRVAVWSALPGGPQMTVVTGADGRWRALLDPAAPLAGRWQVAVVDSRERLLSPLVGQIGFLDSLNSVEAPGIPTSDDCVNGHQWLTVNFQAQTTFPDYTLVSTRYISCQDNHLNHNLRVWVIEADGTQRRGTPVRFHEQGGFEEDKLTGADIYKPAGYIDYNLPGRQEFTVQVLAGPSGVTPYLSSMTPPTIDNCGGNNWGHHSYEVIFQHGQ
ncbi:MAG: carboxypeptidase-like regulatory domain-containing protein [Anaerolineae bacterium]